MLKFRLPKILLGKKVLLAKQKNVLRTDILPKGLSEVTCVVVCKPLQVFIGVISDLYNSGKTIYCLLTSHFGEKYAVSY